MARALHCSYGKVVLRIATKVDLLLEELEDLFSKRQSTACMESDCHRFVSIQV